ncbi:MAG: 50S ribosomal protein L23 [Deltaproteobacteria bacterium]|nr:50S ribosomal protein L23 [Deltaproteobacteria bacterium]
MRVEDVIQRPLVTEKAARQTEKANEYLFAVHPRATKGMIREAVETLFKVNVVSVHTTTMPGKYKRVGKHFGKTTDWKKAYVRLKEKETIQIFEGK